MREAAFVTLTLLLYLSWYLPFAARAGARRHGSPASEALVYAGLALAAQLVGVAMVAGALGLLRLPFILAANGAVAAALFGFVVLHRKSAAPSAPGAHWREFASPCNAALALLAVFLLAWLGVAAWLLPPRGVDDITYHLPPLYEALRTGSIPLLPLELRVQFAQPLGGDLLFLWPLVFFHADTWIDFVQTVVAVFGIAVIFAFARILGVDRRDALFAGLLWLFVPVVLGQAGSNYVEIIVAVCYLVLLYAAVRYWQTGEVFQLAMAGLAAGFGLGTKYNMLVGIVGVAPIIGLRMLRDRNPAAALRGAGAFVAAAAPLPAYWIVRNALVTGHPLFPFTIGLAGIHSIGNTAPTEIAGQGAGSALGKLVTEPVRFLLYLLQDPGLGSLNGGLGVVVFGLGVPAFGWCLWRALRSAAARDYFPLLLWAQVLLIAAVVFLQVDATRLRFNLRLLLALVPLTLLALALLLRELRTVLPAAALAIRAFAVGASLLAVVHLASYPLPSYQILEAVRERAGGLGTSPYHYYDRSSGDLPKLAVAFEPLDWLTAAGPGWNVYMAAEWPVFLTAPLFGSRIQNAVWNFDRNPAGEPDAFVFHSSGTPGTELYYVIRPITPDQVARDDRYELVNHGGATELWVRRALLAEPAVRARLTGFYRRRYGPDIEVLKGAGASIPAGAVVVTASTWGHALKYLALTGAIKASVYLAPPGREATVARQLGGQAVVTLNTPLPGRAARPLATLPTADGDVQFLLNEAGP